MAAGTRVAHLLFLIPLPRRGRGSRRRPERSASGVEGRGGRTQRLEVTPAAPLTLPSPPKGRGKEERAPRASMTEAEAPRGGMTKVGRPAAACHPRAWPSHGGRDARRASSFPDSSPPPGERIKERGDAPRKRSRRQRGDAPRGSRWRQRPPLTLPSPPKGRGKEERPPGILVLRSRWPACADAAGRSLRVDSSLRRLRSELHPRSTATCEAASSTSRAALRRTPCGNDRGGASGSCLSPPRVAVASRQGRASRIPFSVQPARWVTL